jgi:hypothetical protein
VIQEERDVLPALPEGRQRDRDYADPIVEVVAESAGLQESLQVEGGKAVTRSGSRA